MSRQRGGKRPERVGDLLRDEIADILRSAVSDPRLKLVGVTAVEVSGDLQHARVFVSAIDPGADIEALMQVLARTRGFMRGELRRRRLDLRHLPEIEFVHDQSIAQGSHIEALLRGLKQAAGGESEAGSEPDRGAREAAEEPGERTTPSE